MQLDHSHDRRVRSASEHCVQFYDADTGALTRRVANFIAEGCRSGETTLVVATAVHREAFLTALSDSRVVAAAIAAGTLVLRDVLETLDRIVVRGYPQRDRFDASIGALVRDAATPSGKARVRAYGEMVGVLWQAAQYPAAIRLEQLWNGLRRQVPLTLYCGYPIDVFGPGFDGSIVDGVLRAHERVMPTQAGGTLDRAVSRAIGDVLGLRREDVAFDVRSRTGCRAWAALPSGEALVLWLRSTYPERADEILSRARSYPKRPLPSTRRLSGSTARSSVP